MKVIQQLIEYFERKRKLKPRQKRELIARGYWSQVAPADLQALAARIGESFFFQVTGEEFGPLWGTDVYTSDSSLATACVHAGLLQSGETGLIQVTMVQPLRVFTGSTRNGVTSDSWTTPWSGAFRVERVDSDHDAAQVGSSAAPFPQVFAWGTSGDGPGMPVQPSGHPVGPDTDLQVGTPVLANWHGDWWQAQVLAPEAGGLVRIRYTGWGPSWDESVPHSRLQLDVIDGESYRAGAVW